MSATKTWIERKRRSMEPIAPDARAAALTVAGCLVIGGVVTIVSAWSLLMCNLGGELGRAYCNYELGIGGLATLLAGVAVFAGVTIAWRALMRPVDVQGGRGWRWGQGVVLTMSSVVIALMLPTYSCPDGYELTPVFNWCGNGEDLISHPQTNLGWRLLIVAGGVVVGAIVARARRLPWIVSSVLTVGVFGVSLTWLLKDAIGLL
jgi:hypothetical protein